MKKFLYELYKKIILIITRERYVHLILFISTLLIILLFLLVNLLLFPNEDSSYDSTSSIEEAPQKPLRNLEYIFNNTNNISNVTDSDYIHFYSNYSENETNEADFILIKIKRLKLNVTEKILFYEFVKSISTGFYYGNWGLFQVKKNKFHDSKGEGYLNFYKKSDKNYLLNLGSEINSSRITAYLTLKDGEYIDDYLECNFTFTLEDIKIIDLKNESINIILYDVPVSYSWEEYIDSGKLVNLNHSFINLTFYKNYRQFQDYMEYKLSSNNFGNITLEIRNSTDSKYAKYAKILNTNNNTNNDTEILNYTHNDIINTNNIENSTLEYQHNFEVSFKGIAYGSKYYSKRTLDYSIFISICCMIEIYLTSEFTRLVNSNEQMAINTDLYTILFHIMWTSLICGANFFMSLTRSSSAYEYGMPSFCYFALFSIFLLRILFMAWRARNRDITNMRLFRKKLLKFYLFFYVFLFISLISVKIWYSYFICTLVLMGSTWICQIIYSAKNGTKPPMSYLYIISTSFSKISLSFYLKAYKGNIFGYRPNYLKVFIVSFVIAIEALILIIQKFFGAKYIIPKKFRKQGYDYYRKENEISEEEKEVECVICLDKLRNLVNLDDDNDNNNNVRGNIAYKFFMKQLEKIKKNGENKGEYMITPCHHLFHRKCLEHWLNVKNQCPYCRQQIPPLEEF